MPMKNYRVIFARSAVGKFGNRLAGKLPILLAEHGPNLPAIELANERFQVRDLTLVRTVWQGTFVKLRDDAPNVVARDDVEHALNLNDGDHVIEKCHFLLRQTKNLIIWQNNRMAGGLTRAAEYFGRLLDEPVLFPQVMDSAELEEKLNGHLYQVEFAYDRPPARPNAAPEWSENAFHMMSNVDAAFAKFTLRAPRGGALANKAKGFVRQLVRANETKKISIKMTEEMEVIDLFMAPLKDTISVELLGRYPVKADVLQALEDAYDRSRAQINAAIKADDDLL